MILTHISKIKGLDKKEYAALRKLCLLNRGLANIVLYEIKENYKETGKTLSYNKCYHIVKEKYNYKQIQANCSQQTIKDICDSYKGFFNSLKGKKKSPDKYKNIFIKEPGFKKPGELVTISVAGQQISGRKGYVNIPLSNDFKQQSRIKKIEIKKPSNLEGKVIKEMKIVPIQNGLYFELHFVYEHQSVDLELNQNNQMAIDVGLNNLATCVTSDGLSWIYSGRKLKSINHYYNKKKASLNTQLSKQGLYTSKRVRRLTAQRNRQIKDGINKVAIGIIKDCIKYDIGEVIVGYNKDMKQNINIGKINNQNFVQVPIAKLIDRIELNCQKYGIKFVRQDESYTSKASFLDNDFIPNYEEGNRSNHKFSGKRIKRGLYQSSEGLLINADVNAAFNILKKCKKLDSETILLHNGCLDHPEVKYINWPLKVRVYFKRCGNTSFESHYFSGG